MDIVVHIDTTNPDIVDRLREACERVGLDRDNEGDLHPMELIALTHGGTHSGPCCGNEPLYGTTYDPDPTEGFTP